MPVLHLGVLDLPYSAPPPRRGGKVKSGHQTTGDVAGWLEDKYHVMEVFYRQHEADVAGALETSLQGELETLLMGAPAGGRDPFAAAGDAIKDQFSHFLLSKEIETLGIPGVPTQAALDGVSHRFKRKRSVPGRPSFVDTGLYENTFRAWVT